MIYISLLRRTEIRMVERQHMKTQAITKKISEIIYVNSSEIEQVINWQQI